MKRFIQLSIVCLSALVLIFAIGCTSSSPTAPTHTVPVTVKFISPTADEVVGANILAIEFTNISTGIVTKIEVKPTSIILTPEKKFAIYESKIDLPTGDIGEKVDYRMTALFLGFPAEPGFPSQDVSHLITLNGSSFWVGDIEGMRFTVSCDGDIEPPPNANIETFAYRTTASMSTFANQFVGDIRFSVDELYLGPDGEVLWRPVLLTYNWSSEGVLPTFRYRKTADANHAPSTTIQLGPSLRDRYVRVKAALESGGSLFNVTNQVNINVPGEISGEGPDGYRIYRVFGGYGGGKG